MENIESIEKGAEVVSHSLPIKVYEPSDTDKWSSVITKFNY